MKTIKELLVLLRRKLPWVMWTDNCYGLCSSIFQLYKAGYMNRDEKDALLDYLYAHAPEIRSGIFWFKPRRVLPRYMFLTRLINELK
jgi:hypothetical protein